MNLRQQPIATAQVYVRRFYTKVEIRRTNPYTVMTTAVYLASKMEESPVHIRFVLGEAVRQWPGKSETLVSSNMNSILMPRRTWI